MGNQRDDPDRKLFGDLVRKLREQRGMTRDQLGAEIGHTGSTTSNIESGYRAPTPEQAASLDRVFGLPGVLAQIEARLHSMSFSAGFRPFAPYEAEAMVLRTFESTMITGLLQTPDYARAILNTHPKATPELVEARLRSRLERQAILERERPPLLWLLLDPLILTREVGSPKITAGALRHLADMAGRPNITVQVLGSQTHSGLSGACVVAQIPGRHVAYMETTLDGTTTEDPAVVAALECHLDTLRAEALRASESLELIERAIGEHE